MYDVCKFSSIIISIGHIDGCMDVLNGIYELENIHILWMQRMA